MMEVMNMMVVSIVQTHASWVGILTTRLAVMSQQFVTWALSMKKKPKVELIWRTWFKSLKVFCFLFFLKWFCHSRTWFVCWYKWGSCAFRSEGNYNPTGSSHWLCCGFSNFPPPCQIQKKTLALRNPPATCSWLLLFGEEIFSRFEFDMNPIIFSCCFGNTFRS